MRVRLLVSLLATVLLAAQAAAQQRRARRIPTDEEVRQRLPAGLEFRPDVAYRKGPSEHWRLDVVLPKAPPARPRPGMVFVHGGGWRSGDKRSGYFLRGAIEYARSGYVCITVNYRLTDEAPFPACLEDVKCAVRWFRAHAKELGLDPTRIGAYGNSAGAHLVSLLGLCGKEAKLEGDGPWQDHSSAVQAVCASATPADLLNWPKGLAGFSRPGGLLDGPRRTLTARAKTASPVSWVRADAPPFLLFHGTADAVVACSQGDALYLALAEAGARDVLYFPIKGASHGVFLQHQRRTLPVMKEFFGRVLGHP